MASSKFGLTVLLLLVLLIYVSPVAGFGAGNIASISKIEGKNWRHGDIEDMLQNVAFLRGHKWTSAMIKRVYFGNWLRDYSQAVDVGTLKGVQSGAIRIIVWVLAFMSFGYATREYEVTEERLGLVYRPEEHLDNPVGYPDDAQKYDPRLRPTVQPIESQIDPNTGMKNYLANESGGWATGSGYVKYSLGRAIHFGRMYTSGAQSGREEDLFEALRCLGQALHCMEDFGAHTNYVELALRELGYNNVFPHCGSGTMINIRGKHVFPLVTGTFGGVDFVHSVLGEATDHVTSSEVDEVNTALVDALNQNKRSGSGTSLGGLTDVLGKVPGTGDLIQEARRLQDESDQQESILQGSRGPMDGPYVDTRASATAFQGPPGSAGGPPAPGIPGMSMDPEAAIKKIYPILVFRDNVVRHISAIISKIPGLEALLDKITERVTLFCLSLLAPFVIPIINAVSKSLKTGSSALVDASGRTQFQVWERPDCSDPTHSMLSKDHFSNILNEPAGKVASAILQYVAPRVIYAMEHPDVPVPQVMDDVLRAFHHPALRDPHLEIHKNMFSVVEQWVQQRPDRGSGLDHILGSESVKVGKNHVGGNTGDQDHSHGGLFSTQNMPGFGASPFQMFSKKRELDFEEEPLPDTSHLNFGDPAQYGGQYGQFSQQSYGQPSGSYVPHQEYAQQSFQPHLGSPPAADPYAYSVGTNYQQGYQDGSYQHQQQQQGPPGPYGQPYGGQYPDQQGPYGKY